MAVFQGDIGRAIVSEAPRINAGDGTAEFGEGLLAVVVADEFTVALEAGVIISQINFLREVGDLLDAGVVGDPVADEALGVFAPELMVSFEDVVGQRSAAAGG